MNEAIVVAFFQFLLVLLKHLNVRMIVHHNVIKSMLLTLGIQISWLVSTAIGVNAFLNQNWWIVAVYLISGVAGNYVSFYFKVQPKAQIA